ncbi:MAG TPA: hypothetical protein VJ063_10880 [Verrucomicrobiae bacterium]|nr:hypothetical protein [Verrucomicrobiae bacterium]
MIRRILTLWLLLAASSMQVRGAGVTIITHGLNSNADDWVLAMAQRVPLHPNFPGTNFSCYAVDMAANFTLTPTRIGGGPPTTSDSGEIVLKFDWGPLANNNFSTYQVAAALLPALLRTNFILGLAAHAIAEYPLHLVGHSRGGSLICELSRLLGTNGIWVDHLTTLDPHPLNNDGFNDAPIYTVVDAPARTYENVLFHDNYFQIIDFFIYGEPVRGAYTRQLTNLDGGYGGIGGAHSDVHLWYHATVDLRTPASDSVSSLTATERQTWWTAAERGGTNAGFLLSSIGGANRLNAARAGFNQQWELGAGVSNNRDPLGSARAAIWPNIVRLDLVGTNLTCYYQTPTATISFGFDPDGNPLNNNERIFRQITVPSTGVNTVSSNTIGVSITSPDRIFARITAGTLSRFLYLPAMPRLNINTSNITVIARLGEHLSLQTSTNLKSWTQIATNSFSDSNWIAPIVPSTHQFYRAVSVP